MKLGLSLQRCEVVDQHLDIASFRERGQAQSRCATFGFNDEAKLDGGTMWSTSFALTELTAADEARIVALVKKAVS